MAYALKRPVAELDISVDEFAHWIAFESIHPFDDMRNEFMLAQLISVVVSALGKARPKPVDFMLSSLLNKSKEKPKPKDEFEQIKSIFKAFKDGD